MSGLRIHITGSAAIDSDGPTLTGAHALVRILVKSLIAGGAGLVLGVGDEPYGASGEPCIFDWTALDVVSSERDPAPGWSTPGSDRFVVVASQRALEKVPTSRDSIWSKCRTRSDLGLKTTPTGWRMGGIIRERQSRYGDVLVGIGGGAGVEHLAQLYIDDRKPVIPLHTELGALSNDGNGGSRYLHERALENTTDFFRLRDGAGDAAARLSALRLSTATNIESLARALTSLVADLRPRDAFYVRLLARDHSEFPAVDRFFRNVVDTVVSGSGFMPLEMGQAKPEVAFMNVAIFEALHRCGLAVVDLTGVRPNCTLELGYALARRRRVVITAKKGTILPFDSDKLPTYLWDDAGSEGMRVASFRDWFNRYLDLPPLVE